MKKIFFLLLLMAQYYNCFAINKTNVHLNSTLMYDSLGLPMFVESIAIDLNTAKLHADGHEKYSPYFVYYIYEQKNKKIDSFFFLVNKYYTDEQYFFITKTNTVPYSDSIASKIIVKDLADNSFLIFTNNFTNKNINKKNVVGNILLKSRNRIDNKILNEIVEDFYDENKNILSFQSQLLQLSDLKNEIEYGIKKRNKATGLPNFFEKKEIISKNKIADIKGDIDISQLESGNYTFYIKLLKDGKTLSFAEKNFQRYNTYKDTSEPIIVKEARQEVNDFNSNIDLSKTFVAKYNTANLVKNLNAIMPICSKFQVQGIQHILTSNNDTLLRRYFYNFWSDKNSKNPEGEWKLYADKLNYVAKKYGTSSQMGYQTDRGKVYLRFGEPATQERILNETGTLPYEIWQYASINNTNEPLFIFCQMGAVGAEMVLLHTTLPGERNNLYWKETLFTNGVNNNSRVFYYINTGNEMR